jgi:hypothetical protein
MSEEPRVQLTPHAGKRTCPFCHGPFLTTEKLWECPRCSTVHHTECASENQKCAILGCGGEAPRLPGAREESRSAPLPPDTCVVCRERVSANNEAVRSWRCSECYELQHLACVLPNGICGRPGCGASVRLVDVAQLPPVEAPRWEDVGERRFRVGLGVLGLALFAGAGWLWSIPPGYREIIRQDHFEDLLLSRAAGAFWCQVAAMTAVFWAVRKTPLEKIVGGIAGVVGLTLLVGGDAPALGGVALLVFASRLITGRWTSNNPD